ncbi:MAG: catalase family peroxidase [Actinobacteria bacterium]|nr:catalase family peroxidase [Actinomycetota bacterium]
MTQFEEMIDAANAVDGVHAGHRALHAKGTCCEGTFTATSDAARLSRAPHFSGDTVPVTVRFSNASGRPDKHDGERDGRGMATKFRLPGGASTDIVAVSRRVFFVRTPEDFLELMRARVPDPATGQPDPTRIGEFVAAHPESLPALEESLGALPIESYLRASYHGIHAFRLVDGDGTVTVVRYRWEPDDGPATISDEEAATRDGDYLQRELTARLGRGPASFTLHFQQAGNGDDPNDPTVAWPDDRPDVTAGHLELTGVVGDQQGGCEALIFDPTRVVDGVECSDDPILHARSGAYGVSYERRGTRE